MCDELILWLRDSALPLWDRYGVDRASGGYFEQLRFHASSGVVFASGEVRRGRVVARQIFVFDAGQRLGFRSRLSDPVAHGSDYLFQNLLRDDGLFHTALDAGDLRPRPGFSLYEHAFYLFALARLHARGSEPRAAAAAAQCLAQMRRRCGRVNGGFDESIPSSLPLKSNPHMHLLEAALAWIEQADYSARPAWIELGRELVGLALRHFIAEHSGAIHEYFDAEWRPMSGDAGRIIEPGHQFEWAWLLMKWAGSEHCSLVERKACLDAAARLVGIGETWGVAERGVVVNELWDDMTVKDSAAKIWPQTERLKAWCAMLENAQSSGQAALATLKIEASIRVLQSFFLATPSGLWQEVSLPDGSFTDEPTKASSLYHIVCAVDTLQQTVGSPSQVHIGAQILARSENSSC